MLRRARLEVVAMPSSAEDHGATRELIDGQSI
jgi:hypothetical protein